jgi:hypothetical protein
MKGLIVIAVLALGGYLVYTNFYVHLSEEEQKVKNLEIRFQEAASAFVGSSRISGGTGIDMLSGVENAVETIKKTNKKLTALKFELKEEKAIARADKLKAAIKEFMRKNDILEY